MKNFQALWFKIFKNFQKFQKNFQPRASGGWGFAPRHPKQPPLRISGYAPRITLDL